MYVRPHWASTSIDPHIFFGNADLNSTTPDTMVLGLQPEISGNSFKFRIVDSDGTSHETVISDPELWAAEDPVHIRAIWDSTNIGVQSINSIVFVSASIGFICGPNGAIFKTTDGGSTWTRLITGITYDLYSIDFFSSSIGFACGELGTVLFTTNGGTDWTVVDSGVTVDLKSIYFRTASIGYACLLYTSPSPRD